MQFILEHFRPETKETGRGWTDRWPEQVEDKEVCVSLFILEINMYIIGYFRFNELSK